MADITTELGLIFLVSVIFMLIAHKLRLPHVVGMLLAGAIIGPNMLGLVAQTDYIKIFAEMGAILLLFFVGIEFGINKITKMGLRPLIVCFVKDAFIFITTYEVLLWFNLGEITSIVLASALTISSTAFFIKFASEKNTLGNPETKLIFIMSIIEDLLAIFLLAIYSNMVHGEIGSTTNILLSILKAILTLTIAYIILQKIVHVIFERLPIYNADDIMLFLSLSFAILMSVFASFIGLAPSIGAFLAGSILASVKKFRKTQDILGKFKILFSAFFFLSIGMLMNVHNAFQNIPIILVMFLIVTCGTFFSVFISSYLLGYKSAAAVRSGLLVLALGEFSLLIATQVQSIVAPFDIISIMSMLVFLTAFAGGILIHQEKRVDSFMNAIVPQNIKNAGKHVSLYLNKVLAEFEPNGIVYATFVKEMTQIVINTISIVLVLFAAYFTYNFINNTLPEYTNYVVLFAIVLIVIPIVIIVHSLKKLLGNTAHAFHKAMGENLTLDNLAMRDSGIAIFMFVFAFLTPFIVTLLKLPSLFGMLYLIPLFLSLLFVWNLATTVGKIIKRKEIYRYGEKLAIFKIPYAGMLGQLRSINKVRYTKRK